MYFCVLYIVCFATFPVLFVYICVLNNCHRVATQLQLNILYHIISGSVHPSCCRHQPAATCVNTTRPVPIDFCTHNDGHFNLLKPAGYVIHHQFNPLNPELNPICYLLALLGAHHFLHVSRIRVKLLTFRLLISYIYIWSTHS